MGRCVGVGSGSGSRAPKSARHIDIWGSVWWNLAEKTRGLGPGRGDYAVGFPLSLKIGGSVDAPEQQRGSSRNHHLQRHYGHLRRCTGHILLDHCHGDESDDRACRREPAKWVTRWDDSSVWNGSSKSPRKPTMKRWASVPGTGTKGIMILIPGWTISGGYRCAPTTALCTVGSSDRMSRCQFADD